MNSGATYKHIYTLGDPWGKSSAAVCRLVRRLAQHQHARHTRTDRCVGRAMGFLDHRLSRTTVDI